MPNRSEVQCRNRFFKHLDPHLVKGPWTKEEDEKLFVDRGHFDLSDPRYAATFDRVARAIGAYD